MPATDTGVFDAEHPPSRELVADCVHCGFCLPACPTYLLWRKEMDSPRGRIHLMRVGLDGEAEFGDGFVRHIDTCLGCMACVQACPSGVQYDKLIEATRQQVERRVARDTSERRFRRLIFGLFPYPRRLRLAAVGLWAYQRSGLRWLVHTSGLLSLLSHQMRAMEGVAPDISLSAAWSAAPRSRPAEGGARKRVGLLLGCVQRVFFAGVNAASERSLAAEGCDVIVPRRQGCCGALMLHAGLERDAAAMARKLIDAFEGEDLDAIAINAAGCGSTLKEYGHLLRDDPEYAERAAAFAAKCKDISEVLADLQPRAPRHPVPLRVAYHDACHLQHAQGVTAAPRQVLATIPGLQVEEIPEGGVCCGSAGIYNLVEPETARELGERKARNVAATGAEAVASSNPGCLLQMRSSLAGSGRPLPMFHLVELLDASIRGTPPARTNGDQPPAPTAPPR